MEEVHCIFCDISSDQTAIEENGYKGRKCPRCDLIYISPRPASDDIKNLYSPAHASAESHISERFTKRLFAKHNLRIIKKFITNGSMLEIGAGAGYFLNEGRKEGFDVYSTELNPIQADFIRNELGIPCEESSLDAPLFAGKVFDIIYHCDVLSHFYDPISDFQRINEKLNKNGIVVFETGNIGDVKDKYYGYFSEFRYPEHLFFFSEKSLLELLKRTGFEFIKIYRYSLIPRLIIKKILKKDEKLRKSKKESHIINNHKVNGVTTSNELNDKNIIFGLKQIIKNSYKYFLYILRYKLGYIMPKKGRPQTIIIIARKKN